MDRIRREFVQFCERVDRYAEKRTDPDEAEPLIKDALYWLYSLTQQIEKELNVGNLSKEQKSACHAILDDPFIKGQLQLRRLATHKYIGKTLLVRKVDGTQIEIPAQTSAGAVFSISTFTVPGSDHAIDHLEHLETTVARLKKYLGY